MKKTLYGFRFNFHTAEFQKMQGQILDWEGIQLFPTKKEAEIAMQLFAGDFGKDCADYSYSETLSWIEIYEMTAKII